MHILKKPVRACVSTPLLLHKKTVRLPPVEGFVMSEEYLAARVSTAHPIDYYFASNFFGLMEKSKGAEEVKVYALRTLSKDEPIKRELGMQEERFDLSLGQFIELLMVCNRKNGITPSGKWITAYVKNKCGYAIATCATHIDGEWCFAVERGENRFRWPRHYVAAK